MTSYLPPIPAVMVELIQALNNDETDLRTVGKIFARDPSMGVNILKVADSPFYGLRVKVNDIECAARPLGIKEIASLCMACMASRTLKAPAHQKTMDLSRSWQHSLATGVIAKVLFTELGI